VPRTPEAVWATVTPKTSVASPSSGAAASVSWPVNQNPHSDISSEERKVLNDRLAHPEDALSDYDKGTMRADPATVLKDDVEMIRGILANYSISLGVRWRTVSNLPLHASLGALIH
jgi:hypothetical protein